MAFMLAVSLYTAWNDANTMDEKAHIPSAYSYLKYFDMRLNPEHPPLIKDLSAIPLLFMKLQFPVNDTLWTDGINEQWTLGEKFIFYSGNNPDILVFWARFPIIILSLVLGWFIFFWAKKIAGPAAGLIALALYALSPNILGHNHLVTTDLGIAVFIFFAFYFFINFLKNPSPKTILWAGIFLALANLAKFSGVLLYPIFGLFLIIFALVKTINYDPQKPNSLFARVKTLSSYLGWFAIICAISFFVTWIYYIPHTYNMPTEKIQILADSSFGGGEPKDRMVNEIVDKMSENPILKPFSLYFLGVAMVFLRVASGNTTYFLGEVTRMSFKSYFPIIYMIKEPLPYLVLIFISFFWAVKRIFQKVFSGNGEFITRNLVEFKQYLRTHITEFSFLFFIVFYFGISIQGNLNLGFRHLFPILPFVYVLTAKLLATNYAKEKDPIWKRGKVAVFSGLLVWAVLENFISFPLYLSYFNEIAGGPKNGYKYVVDSNTDWGQDAKRLVHWVGKNKIDKIRVDYFGGTEPKYYLGNKMIPWNDNLDLEPGWYAISLTYLQSSRYQNLEDKPGYKRLLNREPDLLVGNSIAIFNLSADEIKSLKY